MDEDTQGLLEMLLQVCLQIAPQEPVPDQPPDPETERAADEYCLRLIRHGIPEMPSDLVAEAMIPRLNAALSLGSIYAGGLERLARVGDLSATGETLLEWLLIRLWRENWRDLWLRGVLGE